MSVLVDSSVWIEYFRRGAMEDNRLEWLIEEGLIVSNELILSELLPPLLVRRQSRVAALLRDIPLLPLEIDWSGIVEFQVTCIRNGINMVGIPDLIIAQNARQHAVPLFSRDRHFKRMARHLAFDLF